ncbi:Uncharacterised protein [BD1-7 clade bacterium]|uniref:ATP-dependent RNA helicase HrpA n=1 Tax=BD1-7 clade bacterium TaxID=2029982 RepID=A0A5S9NVG5_9GAMM|nr:Uncharacterised protein [BD1-7 clade bacterium]
MTADRPTPEITPADIAKTLKKDRFHLTRQLKKLQSFSFNRDDSIKQFEKLNDRLVDQCRHSQNVLAARKDIVLEIEYPDLPISQRRDEIAELIRKHQVVVVAGETGSGKTTQLSKLCLDLGRGREGLIGHTQPRRVAASAVATRVAEEVGVTLGQEVGYQVRFTDHSTDTTLLKLMTDGVLLAEIPHDRFLEKYDTLIIDEAHERSLNIDFLLGYIKRILPRRPDLKVIITSATIDLEKFSAHFNDAPIIEVSGRTWPVDMEYRSLGDIGDGVDLSEGIYQVVKEIEANEKASPEKSQIGDVLVFLPGEHHIREASLLLRRSDLPQTQILPLYARLNSAEHRKIFNPDKTAGRRIILATNVAETSLTVPGIRYVIDSGLARMSRYSHRAKVQRLPIEKVSQASANQRAGRCGRIGPGICYRLYDETDFTTRDAFTQPEIQRTNLSAVILQMQIMRLGLVEDFPFLEPPDQRLINDGTKQLVELAALTPTRQLTDTGRQLAQLPVDPRLARIVVEAAKEDCLKEVLVIAAALSIQDPRDAPADKREAAREKHSRFKDTESDFVSLLALWDYVEEQRQALSRNQFRRMCQKEFLSWQRLGEWRETHAQIKRICHRLGFKENIEARDYNRVHRALLTGLLTNIGFQAEPKLFDGTRNRKFRLFPTSHLARKPPKWVMAGDLIETSQLYGHNVARIDPEWLLDIAAHLLKHTYFEPHWSTKQNQALAYQKTSLYGLVIEEKKRVSYSQIDPVVSRELFIRSGLVEEQLRTNAAFYRHNRKLRSDIAGIEEKSRRRDLLANDDDIYQFYDQRVPENVTNLASFDRWRKKAEKKEPKLLFADETLFCSSDAGDAVDGQFPDHIDHKDVSYALSYRFQPGHKDDGITVRVPVTTLNRVPRFLFEWLVPGLLMEKCEALLRGLPKQYRRALVPIPQTAARIVPELQASDASLCQSLAAMIKKLNGLDIPPDAWNPEAVDDYYRVQFHLIGEDNETLSRSRDLGYLLKTYGHMVQDALDNKVVKAAETYTRWTFGDISKEKEFVQAGSRVKSFPAIKDNGDSVSLTLADYPHVQAQVHRKGLVRLAMLTLPQQVKYLRKEMLRGNELQLKLSAEYDKKQLVEDLITASFNHCFFGGELVFDQDGFESRIKHKRGHLSQIANELEEVVRAVVNDDYNARQALMKLDSKTYSAVIADVEYQRRHLVFPGFVYETPIESLKELPKYYAAMAYRLERLQNQLGKDLKYTAELAEIRQQMDELEEAYPGVLTMESSIKYRWMLEEYRVSLFAQQLKTRFPISKKRLEKQWLGVLTERRDTII